MSDSGIMEFPPGDCLGRHELADEKHLHMRLFIGKTYVGFIPVLHMSGEPGAGVETVGAGGDKAVFPPGSCSGRHKEADSEHFHVNFIMGKKFYGPVVSVAPDPEVSFDFERRLEFEKLVVAADFSGRTHFVNRSMRRFCP